MAARTGSSEDVRGIVEECLALGLSMEDTEIEHERLQARLDVLALDDRLARGELPRIDTQHKAVGAEDCCFLAPAVWCGGETDQPGKLFLTGSRLRFVGGAGVTLRWSAVLNVSTAGRDLLVAQVGNGPPRCFRCNSFSDALVAERLIDHLRAAAQPRAD